LTVVRPEPGAAEDLTKYCLLDHPSHQIAAEIQDRHGVFLSNGSIEKTKEIIRKAGIATPVNIDHAGEYLAWFDLESPNYGINVKWGYESTANSRIRDITKEAIPDIRAIARDSSLQYHLEDYKQFRNGTLHKISNDVKECRVPIEPSQDAIAQIKLAYVICLNLAGQRNKNRGIFFFNFTSNFSPELYLVAGPGLPFDLRNFMARCKIRFSTNTRPGDPHKKTVQYLIEDRSIGFLELRRNKRAMFHLRKSESDWDNLSQLGLIQKIRA